MAYAILFLATRSLVTTARGRAAADPGVGRRRRGGGHLRARAGGRARPDPLRAHVGPGRPGPAVRDDGPPELPVRLPRGGHPARRLRAGARPARRAARGRLGDGRHRDRGRRGDGRRPCRAGPGSRWRPPSSCWRWARSRSASVEWRAPSRSSRLARCWRLAVLAIVLPAGRGVGTLASLAQRVRQFGESASRQHIWQAAWDIFRDHPLVGTGLDTFQIAFADKRTVAYWNLEWNGSPTRAHNEALNILATQGLLGGLAVLVLVAGVVIAARRALRRRRIGCWPSRCSPVSSRSASRTSSASRWPDAARWPSPRPPCCRAWPPALRPGAATAPVARRRDSAIASVLAVVVFASNVPPGAAAGRAVAARWGADRAGGAPRRRGRGVRAGAARRIVRSSPGRRESSPAVARPRRTIARHGGAGGPR